MMMRAFERYRSRSYTSRYWSLTVPREMMGNYTKLEVWKKAHALTLGIYHETARWPSHEQFGLISQARRAAYSIP